jgi:hypothetical protein
MAFTVACRTQLAPVGAEVSRVGMFRVNRNALSHCHARQVVRKRLIVSRRPGLHNEDRGPDLRPCTIQKYTFPNRQFYQATALFVFITCVTGAVLYW